MDSASNVFTVLIADDDSDDRFLAQKAFEDLGFSKNIRFAQDGMEALDYLNQSEASQDHHYFLIPDFIILDLNMPVKDGWETLKEIKNSPSLCKIPTIIWTTSNAEQDRLRSVEMGADCFITKPDSYSNLLFSMHSLIEMYCGSNGDKEIEIAVSTGKKT